MAQYTIILDTELKSRVAEQGLKRLNNQTKQLKKNFNEAFAGGGGGAFAIRGLATELENVNRTLTIALGAVFGAMGLVGRQAINMSAEFETLRVTIETLTGSVEEADMLIRDLKTFAATTPLQLTDVEQGATTLLALGEATDDVIPKLKLLGQAAVALNRPMDQLIRVRQQLAGGIVLARSLQAVGIRREILEEAVGKDLAEATGDELVAGFEKALGRFEGLFERTFNTIRGRLANLRDVVEITFAALGDPAQPFILQISSDLEAGMQRLREFLENNVDAISDAIKVLIDAVANFLRPATEGFDDFMDALERNPGLLSELAHGFINLSAGLAGLVVIGNIAAGLLSILAAATLLRLSIPALAKTIQGWTKTFGAMRASIVSTLPKLGILKDALKLPSVAAEITIGEKGLEAVLAAQKTATAMASARLAVGNFLKAAGKIGIVVGVIIQAFINWRDSLTLIGSAVRLIRDLLALLLIPFEGLIASVDKMAQMLPGITGLNDLFAKSFAIVANSIEIAFRGLSVLIQRLRQYAGLQNDAEAALERYNQAIIRWMDNQGMALDDFEKANIALKHLAGSTDAVATSFDSVDSVGIVTAINAVTRAAAALNDELKPLTGLGAAGLRIDVQSFLLPPELRRILEDFPAELVGAEIAGAMNRLTRSNLKDRLEEIFPELFPKTGGGAAREPELTRAQERLIEFNEAIALFGDRVRISSAELEQGLINTEEKSDAFLNSLRGLIDALNILDIEQELTEPHKKLLDTLVNQLVAMKDIVQAEEDLLAIKEKGIRFREFEEARLQELAELNIARKEKEELAEQLGLDRLLQMKEKREAFLDAQLKLLDQTDRIAKDFLSGLSDIFGGFLSGIGDNEFGDAFQSLLQGALDLGGEALGASMFGKGGFAAGGAFAKGGLLGGLGPGLVASAAVGLAGFAINRLFGGEKALEIEGPVDVNLVDIQSNAANFFTFKGFEGFTFTSRYKAVFEAGLY